MERFELTEDHIALLVSAYVDWWAICELGAPCISPKRPYGNGDVHEDVLEAIGAKPLGIEVDGELYWTQEQLLLAEKLHRETQTALQIVLCCATFETGTYEKKISYDVRSWGRLH